jgi:saccharopine dehydrogenase-like NADP-dependent oxidoreductase
MSTPNGFVAVAGAAGHLGSLIALSLRKRNVAVKALVRPGTAASRTQTLRDAGVTIVEVDMTNVTPLTTTLQGASIVVSALQGLRDVMLGVQGALLNAAVAAKVPRFIPSDYSLDFTKTAPGSNRNLDLRRDFHAKLDESGIKWNSLQAVSYHSSTTSSTASCISAAWTRNSISQLCQM